MPPSHYQVGCAGWSIPARYSNAFPTEGSHLERYAARFPVVEINSSFYRPHRPQTYVRWAAATPDHFRFSVKVPKEITHVRKLQDPGPVLDRFLSEVCALGEKLGPLLVQLPPSLVFEADPAEAFFRELRHRHTGSVVCEPRHPSWFTLEANRALVTFEVARVAADPAVVPGADEPGGWSGLTYFRLHGSPRIYYSRYSEADLERYAAQLTPAGGWCIFDNTAAGEATANALALLERLGDTGA